VLSAKYYSGLHCIFRSPMELCCVLQVFIRTVNNYEGRGRSKSAGSLMVIGGSARISMEGTALMETNPQHKDGDSLMGAVMPVEVAQHRNRCGCTNLMVCYVIALFLVLTAVFIGVAAGMGRAAVSGILLILAIVCFIAMLVSCCIRFCAVCQYPNSEDD
jgi:hypothetical protein